MKRRKQREGEKGMKVTGRKDIKETQRTEGGMKIRRSRKSRGNRGAEKR